MPNVHKDFHGALSFGLAFVEESYGEEGLREFLEGLADTVYRPLVDDVRARGLAALQKHWERIFALEEGEAETLLEGDTLTLRVTRCPAVTHMQEQGYAIAPHFCEHTRIVNEAVCRAAGYTAEIEYDQAKGACVQRFRRAVS